MQRTSVNKRGVGTRFRFMTLAASIAATAIFASVVPSPAVAGVTGVVGIPSGFLPASTSWTSPTTGWVLGFAPCATAMCPTLVSTSDDASTWQAHAAPPVTMTPDQTRIHFANDLDGWATDGAVLAATHDGAATWSRVRLPGAVGSVAISSLAATDRYAYAIVTDGAGSRITQLYSSPLDEDIWSPVAGVAVAGSGGWDIATRGSAAYVSLGVVHESTRLWSSLDGVNWTETVPLCSTDDAVRLSAARSARVDGMCSFNPGRGHMTKLFVEAVDEGSPVVLGRAPDTGITTAFAVTSARSAFVAGVGAGATWLHASFTNGRTWVTPLIIAELELPLSDLSFQDDTHGVVVWGGPAWSAAAIYRTTNGGHTWSQLSL